MDPDVALERIRELAVEVAAWSGDDDVLELIEAVQGLDGWLSRGGFLPAAWGYRGSMTEQTPEQGTPAEGSPEQTEIPVEKPATETTTTEVDVTPETGAPATEQGTPPAR